MKVLIAEDDPVTGRALQGVLARWGHETDLVPDGPAALRALQSPDAPSLALIDIVLPGLDGVEVCRQARAAAGLRPLDMILLHARPAMRHTDVVGLSAPPAAPRGGPAETSAIEFAGGAAMDSGRSAMRAVLEFPRRTCGGRAR